MSDDLLQEARDTIAQQQEFIKQVTTAPWTHGTVVAKHDETLVVATPSGVCEMLLPNFPVNSGEVVRLNEAGAVVSKAEVSGHGTIAVVERTLGDLVEVGVEGQTRVVYGKAEKGERVVLDPSGVVVVQNLGHENTRFRFDAETNVCWNDIGGLVEAKKEMIEAVEHPHRFPELYAAYGKKPISGVLLYGPAGCGKTMIGKATATALARLYGNDSGGFFYIKGPEVLSQWVGVAEATIRQIFERGKRFKEEHGHPAVLFFDEADSIMGTRGTGISSDMEKTIVPSFLTEMDGLFESGAIVILATNREDTLDPAIVRDGRIDRKIRISRPDKDAAEQIFGLYLRNVPLLGECKEFAREGAEALFSSERTFYKVPTKGAFTLGHICHGGMIAGIVDQATSVALNRNLEKPQSKRGLQLADLTSAVECVFVQNRDLDHRAAVAELMEAR